MVRVSLIRCCIWRYKNLTRPGTATSFSLRLRLHYKAARAGGVICTKEYNLNIEYKLNQNITSSEFIEVLKNSTLSKRRPIDDLKTIKGMIENADIIVTATIDEKIIGVARAVTDFNYCCYLSDLAVDEQYQKNGIGKKLISKVQEQLNDKCKIILLSAPDATEYYPKIGFTQHNSTWTLGRQDKLN